jgi:glycerophosphoryl diester phosphodiesterase
MKNKLLIAHRGYSDLYPENTLIAFEKAIESKADMVELDVHLTSDQKLIVIHDVRLGRTVQGSTHVWEHSLAELKALDAGSWKNSKFSDQKVPCLDEVLELCKGKIHVNIEVKKETMQSYPLYFLMLKTLLDTISKHKMNDQLLISSFDPFFMQIFSEAKTGLRGGIINSFPQLSNCLDFCKTYNLYSYHPNAEFLTDRLAKEYVRSGIKLFSWTAKNQEDYSRLNSLPIDGIISNVMP